MRRAWRRARGLGGQFGVAAAATLAALAGGFVNQLVASAVFGMGAGLDVYVATNAITNVAIAAVGGVCGAALATRAAEGEDHRDRHVADVAVPLLAFGALGVALAALAGPAGRVLVPQAFRSDPGLVRLVLWLNLAGMVPNVAATAAAAIVVGRGKTVLGVASPMIVSVGGVMGALVFGERAGVAALAAGTMAGSALRLVVLLLAMPVRLPRVSTLLDSAGFWIGSAGLMASSAVVAAVSVADKVALAPFDAGTVSHTAYAMMLLTSAGTVMSSGLGAPLARRFAKSSGGGRWEHAARATRIGTLFLTPVALLVLVAAEPIAGVLLEWGRVRHADVLDIARAARLGGGVILFVGLSAVTTYFAGRGRGGLVLSATSAGALAGVSVFFGARGLLGSAAVPVGYSVMYATIAAICLAAFVVEGGHREEPRLRQLEEGTAS